jgi:nitrous oxide reductase
MQAEREGWVAKRLVAAFRGKFRDSGTARVPAQLSFESSGSAPIVRSVGVPVFRALLHIPVFTSHGDSTGREQPLM